MPHTVRQGPGQRQDDIDGALAKSLVLIAKNRGRILAIAVTLSSALTFVVTTIAARVYAPDVQQLHSEVRDINVKIESTGVRVGRLETSERRTSAERDTLKESIRWISYMQCSSFMESNPGKYVPPICSKPR